MRRLFAVPVAFLALGVVTALQAFPALASVRADPVTVLVIYLAFRADVVGGAISTLLLGALMDAAAGSTLGLHMLVLQAVFVLGRVLANAVQFEPGPRLWPLAAAATLLTAFLVTMLVATFGEGRLAVGAVWSGWLSSLVANAVLAWPLLGLTDALARRWSPEPDRLFLPR